MDAVLAGPDTWRERLRALSPLALEQSAVLPYVPPDARLTTLVLLILADEDGVGPADLPLIAFVFVWLEGILGREREFEPLARFVETGRMLQ